MAPETASSQISHVAPLHSLPSQAKGGWHLETLYHSNASKPIGSDAHLKLHSTLKFPSLIVGWNRKLHSTPLTPSLIVGWHLKLYSTPQISKPHSRMAPETAFHSSNFQAS
ncbi:hypothetical protein AVEN_67186-1 [Araneus ventricosus]|uniref:Uncharacterized protein n=1 Tax=Araneus ventricosus TaxID=182803 RepID=A0A4Y2HDE7_ARAVE|nr:hypothetical protein AVEN_67186-1 [Araneus ventricosus]